MGIMKIGFGIIVVSTILIMILIVMMIVMSNGRSNGRNRNNINTNTGVKPKYEINSDAPLDFDGFITYHDQNYDTDHNISIDNLHLCISKCANNPNCSGIKFDSENYPCSSFYPQFYPYHAPDVNNFYDDENSIIYLKDTQSLPPGLSENGAELVTALDEFTKYSHRRLYPNEWQAPERNHIFTCAQECLENSECTGFAYDNLAMCRHVLRKRSGPGIPVPSRTTGVDIYLKK